MKGHTKVWILFGTKGCVQAKSHGKKASQDGSISTSGCTSRKPLLCVYPEEGSLFKNTHILYQRFLSVSTVISQPWLWKCIGVSPVPWKEGLEDNPAQQINIKLTSRLKFWHICLDLQMSGREVPFHWIKCVQSAELLHPQLWIQVSPWILIWGGQEMSNFLTSSGRREGPPFIKVVDPCQLEKKGIVAMEQSK